MILHTLVQKKQHVDTLGGSGNNDHGRYSKLTEVEDHMESIKPFRKYEH
jgi:hypothetical protein